MENPTPDGPIEWIIAAVAGLIAAVGLFVRNIIGKSDPCDREMRQFRDAIHEDVTRIEKKLDKAIEDGKVDRREFYERFRLIENRVVYIEARCPKQEPT